MYISVQFLIVSSGYNGQYLSQTEILNTGNTLDQSPQFQDHPKSISGVTGGFLNEEFITCGGDISGEGYTDQCFKLGSVEPFSTMIARRGYAVSIILKPGKLWILGGQSCGSSSCKLSSTEYIFADGRNEEGPPMPIALYYHAMVKINDTTSILVGGLTGSGRSKRTWYYDGKWLDGPDLEKAKNGLSVGIIRDSVTYQVYVVAAGGASDDDNDLGLNDVEILSVTGTAWQTGNVL